MTAHAVDPAVAPLLAPVAGARPAGRDLRYDPRYDAVREARREDAELPGGGLTAERKVADWAEVLKQGAALLVAETKDLQLAAWYAEAALARQGLAGLAAGLDLLRGLLDGYWDTLHPELEDGEAELRLGVLEWVGSRLAFPVRRVAVARDGLPFYAYVEAQGVVTEEQAGDSSEKREQRERQLAEGKRAPEAAVAAVAASPKAFYKELVAGAEAARAALAALEATTDARFAGDPPSYRALHGALDEVHRFAQGVLTRKLEVDPDPLADVMSADGRGSSDAPDGGVGDDVTGGAGATKAGANGAQADGAAWPSAGGALAAEPTDAADAAARVVAAARFLRAQDPTSPAPYLLLRGLRWGELRAAAAAGAAPDPRLLDAPPTPVRTRLKTLLLEGRWPELLEVGEQVMGTPAGRGWLDLQRYAVTACARLGPGYDAVAAAVRADLRALLEAVPDLPEMTLMDDTPVANDATYAWLTAERLAAECLAAERLAAEPDPEADAGAPDGSRTFADAFDGEVDGDALAGGARGAAARRRPGGRRRADPHGGPSEPADPFQHARAELARGRPTRAVELLVAELDRERSARGRFVRQTQIAQVMVEAGMAAVARPILQRLVATIDERKLDEWEAGALVAQPLVLMCRVIDALELDEGERDALYLKVCQLDPLQAMALRRG